VPRPVRENYWEPVRLEPGETKFLLLVHPRLEAPSEGPWMLIVRDAGGSEAFRAPGQRVDVATGGITLLCEAARFPKGDWTIELALEEGGRTSGPSSHTFRFRVE
jgi:hypothetical protein